MTNMTDQVYIQTEQDIVVARRSGRAIARKLGFSLVDQSRIAISISELARNIYLYAGNGTIHIRSIKFNGKQGVEIIAEDLGPGIRDPKLALLDSYSTSNGLGMGLPGTQRLMNEFHLKSTSGTGTTVLVRKWLPHRA